ncbi:FadR family transcriptional regulator [Diaphorobacter ruginosibacter]|uniref:FadR family transcriptional regulator n=1 Tax=Diaphorobacter ruginosibacter TaxID=1715720 RepID=A0A7G9RTF8_9BURK|nr:FadR/GntR family transcriptional regulator [Diaphorobacter ruginosibacter]QNN58883.1 FadR family transcriptional regulator [Diaphorobacter ruginosibacter]
MESVTGNHHPASTGSAQAVAGNTARVIREWIESGVYPVGSLLPSQRELSDRLGVSRTSLREALSTLQGLGLVMSRPGKGVYVTQAPEVQGAEVWRFADSHALTDVYQLRYVLEGFAARLASLVIEPEDLRLLRTNWQAMTQHIENGDFAHASQLDFEFHLQIAMISGNKAMAEILRNSGDVMQESQRLPYYKRGARHATCEEHAAIIDGLESGRADAAQQAMTTHIIQAAQRAGVHFPTGR